MIDPTDPDAPPEGVLHLIGLVSLLAVVSGLIGGLYHRHDPVGSASIAALGFVGLIEYGLWWRRGKRRRP